MNPILPELVNQLNIYPNLCIYIHITVYCIERWDAQNESKIVKMIAESLHCSPSALSSRSSTDGRIINPMNGCAVLQCGGWALACRAPDLARCVTNY